ncbi:MAG: hypothetical protein IKZ51_04600 [Bacteroidales bacterium]|nr:hypothetical protein [Bacteroidales bacterium]
MKRIIVIAVLAVMALATANNAFAQRKTVPYASLGPLASFTENDFGVGVAAGFRNYNRNAFVSFSPSLELFAEAFPADKRFGAFLVPEIGVAIGPKGFKFYPHTGLMLGYDTGTGSFAWGGKSGTAFDFGKHFTLDFCTYMPGYSFTAVIWAANFVWRF